MKCILPFVWPYRRKSVEVLSLTLIVTAPWLIHRIILTLKEGHTVAVRYVTWIAVGLMGVHVSRSRADAAMFHFSYAVAFKTCRDVRTAIYRNLHTLSLGWYIQHKSGDITKHVVDAKMRLEPGLADTIYGFVTALILAVGGIILLTLSRLLTFLALASLPVAHYIMARIGREAAPRSLKRPIAKRG